MNSYLMTWTSNNGWEDGSWGVISGESGFAHTGAIVYYQSCYIIVTHLESLVLLKIKGRENRTTHENKECLIWKSPPLNVHTFMDMSSVYWPGGWTIYCPIDAVKLSEIVYLLDTYFKKLIL